jgi:hypothetical protein
MSFKQFETDFMNAFKPTMKGLFSGKEGREFAASLGEFLIDGKEPKPIKKALTAIDRYMIVLFDGYTEIVGSFYTLRDIETIIVGLTARQSKVGKVRLLSYHIHNYLNENYILECRLVQYPVKILRKSKRWSSDSDRIIKPINQAVFGTFANIVAARGRHVHDRRYTATNLDRLSMMERAIAYADPVLEKPWRDLFRIEYAILRGEWLNRIRKNNDGVEKLLDAYFAILQPLILDQSGKILIPSEIKGA